MFVKNGTGRLRKVLLSPPDFLKAAKINEIAKLWNYDLDNEKMKIEFQALVQAYKDNDIEVCFLGADEERPNSVFARDFGGCVKEGYILGNFKYPLRFKEHIDYEKRMEELGVPLIARCNEGILEGGDFAFLDERTIAIGMADRTDELGVNEVREQLAPLGYEVIGVTIKKEYLHLDMCFNLVDETLAVAYVEGLPKSFVERLTRMGIELIPVTEESIFAHGCNLQALGNKKVLSLKQNEWVNEELRKKGINVIELDITEILKAGGGPHCMTFPLLRD